MRDLPFAAALGAVLLASLVPTASAQFDKLKLSDTIQSLTFAGDLRLRNDVSAKRGAGQNDRGRLRYRLRFGLEAQLPDGLKAVFRLASGTGEQTSTNQSYGKLASQKGLSIDAVYLKWTPALRANTAVNLTGGRMINPLWRIQSSDVVWNDTLNPEGFGEGLEHLFPETGASVFANGLQWAADEDSNSGKNQWVFSQQFGFEARMPFASRLRLAAAYHKWSDENRSSLSQPAVQDGNRRLASGALANRFGVGELTGQLSGKARGLPVSLQATLVRNFRARNNSTTITGPVARDAYQFGAIIGAAKAKGAWEAAYFKKYAQTDATVADATDSDFGDGGTNRVGHIVWAAYAPRDWMQLKAKASFTDVIDRVFAPGDKAVNRLQMDLSVKF